MSVGPQFSQVLQIHVHVTKGEIKSCVILVAWTCSDKLKDNLANCYFWLCWKGTHVGLQELDFSS